MSQQPPYQAALPATVLPRGTGLPLLSTSVRPAALSAPPDAWALLHALRRRWKLAVVLGLLLAAAAGGTTYGLFPRSKFTAVATLHVASHPGRIIWETREQNPDYRTFQRTQVAMMLDRRVLSHALAKPEVAALPVLRQHPNPEEWLATALSADFPGGSEVLQVSLSDNRPEGLAELVNAVVDSYMTLVVEDEKLRRTKTLDELRRLRDRYEADLKQKRKSLRMTVAEVGLSDQKAVALTQQYKADSLAAAQHERMQAHSDLIRLKARLATLEAARASAELTAGPEPESAGADAGPALAALAEQDQRVRELRQVVRKLERDFEEKRRKVRAANDPTVVNARRKRDEAVHELRLAQQSALEEAGRRVAEGGRGTGTGPGGGGPKSELESVRISVAETEAFIAALEKDIAGLQNEVKSFNEGSLDLETDREDLQVAQEVWRTVGTEFERRSIELEAPDRIKQLSRATPPGSKNDRREVKVGAAVAAGAFAFALLGVSYWEFSNRRVSAVDDVVNGLGIRLVGTVPSVARAPALRSSGRSLEVQRRLQNRLVESVDAMRAVLLHESRAEGTRVVMISSAVQGEGKTSLACHLAASLARAGRKTILVDSDLRRPACHRALGMPQADGLCEYLRGEAGLDGVVRPTPSPGLDFMSVGRCDDRALSALAQDVLRDLFADLRAGYDFVIVDSPPVLPVADSLLIGHWADTVIFSVLSGASRLPSVHAAYERLTALGIRTLGAVVSNVEAGTVDYYESDNGEPAWSA